MTDRQTFGPVLHRLPFGQAIEEGLLCDYRVLVVGVPTPPAAPTGNRAAELTHCHPRSRSPHCKTPSPGSACAGS
jgi:predicted helicase